MKVFTLPNGNTVSATDQFEIGDQKYPAGWLSSAADGDIAAVGITVSTIADPPPAPLTVSALAFRQLFTTAERLAITTAAMQSAAIREFMDDESAAGTVSMADPELIAGINALVGAGLLTQDRANEVMAATAPPAS